MKIYGDLLRCLPLDDNLKLKFIKSSKQNRFCTKSTYLKNVFRDYVKRDEFIKLQQNVRKYIFKLKEVNNNVIPIHITHLNFSSNFNKEIDLKSNVKLTHLKFGDRFNKKINLKQNVRLTHFQFGGNFNREIDFKHNIRLTHLQFGWEFNQSLDLKSNVKLTYLRFGNRINQEIDLSHNHKLEMIIIYDHYHIIFSHDVKFIIYQYYLMGSDKVVDKFIGKCYPKN